MSDHQRPLRLGIHGLGAVAQSVHLPLVSRLPDRFHIAAVCDISGSVDPSHDDNSSNSHNTDNSTHDSHDDNSTHDSHDATVDTHVDVSNDVGLF